MLTLPRGQRPHPAPEGGEAEATPLCVDLDGTLLAGDLLHEAVLLLLRRRPWRALCLPLWLLRGKAYLKEQLARHVTLDPAALPYRPELVAWLREQADSGRPLVLATASHRSFAQAVADHLALFREVLATEGERNLRGEEKRDALAGLYGPGRFDYVGDGPADLPVWESARSAIVVCPSRLLLRRVRQTAGGEVRVIEPEAAPSRLPAAVRLLRPHHWVKNLLVFAPLLLAHQAADLARLSAAVLAFVCFCCVVSAGYVLNDLTDLQADRRHPTKRRRPLACGAVSLPSAAGLLAGLLAAGMGLALAALPWEFAAMLAAYLGLSVAYSGWLKRVGLLDVAVLTTFYAHRILAGGIATGVPVSGWLLTFSLFFFLSLALAKRHAELVKVASAAASLARRGYRGGDRGLVEALGLAAALLAGLTFAAYLQSAQVRVLYRSPQLLWAVAAVLLFWIGRVWLLALRRRLHEDPVAFALSDRGSYACAAAVVALMVLAV